VGGVVTADRFAVPRPSHGVVEQPAGGGGSTVLSHPVDPPAGNFVYRMGTGHDEWFYGIHPEDRRNLRWTYKHARLCGTDRRVARLIIHSTFHVGVRRGMNR
jgi:hypothetical protein